jgi:hypothetical protein
MRSNIFSSGSLSAVVALLAGCMNQDLQHHAPDRAGIMRVGLVATAINAGETGYAFLIPEDGTTRVVVQVSGVPNWVSRPVHLYPFIHRGTCANLEPQPAYELRDRVLADRLHAGMFTVASAISVSLDVLRSSPYALSVRTSPADGNMAVYCGDLGAVGLDRQTGMAAENPVVAFARKSAKASMRTGALMAQRVNRRRHPGLREPTA